MTRALRGDPRRCETPDGGGAVPAGPVHARGAGGDGASLGGGAAVDQGLPYLEIAARTHASTTTVTRVAHWLRYGEGGYRLALDRLQSASADRLTIAVPAKGRLREPAVSLLEDAGLAPEQPGERALAFPCRNAPVDVLLVRAADIPEYVQDGVVDCGITGHRPRPRARRARRGAAAARLRLVPARRRGARGVAGRAARGARGRDVATVYPRLTRELLPVHGRARRRHRLGRDRAAARARRRDRRPRLVGEHAAHERPALARHAVLVRGGADRARRRRRPTPARLDDARRRRGARAPLPDAERAARRGSRRSARSSARARRACCRSPSRAWSRCTRSCPRRTCGSLLPRLEAAGGSSILVVPVERMAA